MKPPDMYTLWCYSNHLHTVLFTLLSIKISDNSAPIWLKSANKFRYKNSHQTYTVIEYIILNPAQSQLKIVETIK